MKKNATKKKRNKKRLVMHNAIAHHPMTDARAAIHASRPTPPFAGRAWETEKSLA